MTTRGRAKHLEPVIPREAWPFVRTLPVDLAATVFGVSRRTVYRVLRSERERVA